MSVSELAEGSAIRTAIRAEEASILAELKAGSEDAYSWLIEEYHQPIYNLVYRILDDPADAVDATQDVFLKVFRGMARFNGESSLKTWMYRIAIHEASNRRRWFFRHKAQETPLDAGTQRGAGGLGSYDTGAATSSTLAPIDTLRDGGASPYEMAERRQLRARLEVALKALPEHYRTAVVLRDMEGLTYEEIAEMTDTTLGTVKSRLVRGRNALRRQLESTMPVATESAAAASGRGGKLAAAGQKLEVTP
jgi:RNA polymerase sigma-70 factor (ECF subfamily)